MKPLPPSSPNILVVIPTYNEEKYVEQCIRSLVDGVDKQAVIAVVDGMSEDRTVEIVEQLKAEFSNLVLINNPKRLQSAAVNLAVEQYSHFQAGYLVRCDAHSIYPPNFVRDIVSCLDAKGAASVVIPMDAVGETCFEKANAWIVDTPFGSGGAAHRGGAASGYIDHGHHAGFDLQWFRKLDGYDETFSHNEDAEYDHRVIANGGAIYMDADTRIGYVPRGSMRSLLRQYFNYGKGRARTCIKHGKSLKIRQMLPIILVLGLLLSTFAAILNTVFLVPIFSYVLLLVSISIYVCHANRSLCGLWSSIVLASMHIGWGTGFLVQLLRFRFSGKKNRFSDAAQQSSTS